jgi:hypothetical protein
MVNYKNGKIYKLVNDELGLTYFGSTCGELRSRLCVHKSHSKAHNITKCTSKLLFDQGVCMIFLVEEYPTDNKMLLHQRERFYIENNECVNKCLPTRTKREYRSDNKEKISKQKAIYHANNADKINEQNRIYRANNSDKINARQKLYCQKNADKIKEQRKMYQIKNRDKINQQSKAYRARKKIEQSLKTN